jgi:serine/threonine-protein kinase
MGTVFQAHDPKLNRPVALKALGIPAWGLRGRGEQLVSGLLAEAMTLATFNHGNITAVFDVNDTESPPFLAMEYVRGTNLESHMERVGTLPYQQVAPLGLAIARALDQAHRHGVVHHDLKPGNVLLGYDGAIKITDFGLARLVSDALDENDGNRICGTPGFLPPETLIGDGYREPGDLFALGALLYYCLTGRLPFAGANPIAICRATVRHSFDPVPIELPGAPDWLVEIVRRLLSGNPEDRGYDAPLLVEALEVHCVRERLRWEPPKPEPDPSPSILHDPNRRSQLVPLIGDKPAEEEAP